MQHPGASNNRSVTTPGAKDPEKSTSASYSEGPSGGPYRPGPCGCKDPNFSLFSLASRRGSQCPHISGIGRTRGPSMQFLQMSLLLGESTGGEGWGAHFEEQTEADPFVILECCSYGTYSPVERPRGKQLQQN